MQGNITDWGKEVKKGLIERGCGLWCSCGLVLWQSEQRR